jgi:hypothetical protein
MKWLTTNKPALRTAWLLASLLTALWGGGLKAATFADPMLSRQLSWSYQGKDFTAEIAVPLAHYSHYQNKQRYYQNYAWYAGENPAYRLIGDIASALDSIATQQGFEGQDRLLFIIGFVQSIDYQLDPPTEYPKFPAETLVEGAGDCEDTSILLAAILHRLGYPVVLLSPPGHMAVGVGCPTCTGPGISYEGSEFHYVETTAEGYALGEVPFIFQGQPITVIPLTLSEDELALLKDEGPLYNAQPEPVVCQFDSGEALLRPQLLSRWMLIGMGRSTESERNRTARLRIPLQ